MPEATLSERAVYRARPTIRLDGQENLRLSELAISMEMTEQELGLSHLELRLSNIASDPRGGADLAFEDENILSLGSRIAIYVGDETAPTEIFQGMITGMEAVFPEHEPPEIVVLAEDVLQQARMQRRTQTYEDMTIADVAENLASQLNLRPVVTGFTDVIGTEVQFNESDLAFLRRLLVRYDGDLQVVGEELHVSPRDDVQRGRLDLELHSQLRQLRVIADLAHQVTEVTLTGWDAIQGTRVTGQSTGSHLGPGQGRTGSEMVSESLGDRAHHIGHLGMATEREAQALADAAFDERARRFVCVSGTAEGNPSLRVGTHVTISGASARFNNTYYVVKVCHRYDVEDGYKTDFDAECAYLGNPS